MRGTFMLGAALLAGAGAAAAAELPGGVYAASPELCQTARTRGLEAVFEEGNVVLTAGGIQGIEYHCDFVQVLGGRRSPGFVVTALCEEPGYAFPDLLAIVARGEGRLEVTSALDAGGEPSSNAGLYHLCEGVTPP
jgi:hypothetical protein